MWDDKSIQLTRPLLCLSMSMFSLCWAVDHRPYCWPQKPLDKRQRRRRGIGITSFRWPSTRRKREGGEGRGRRKGSNRVNSIIPLSLIVRAGPWPSMHGYHFWHHVLLSIELNPLSLLKDTVGVDSARFNQVRMQDSPLPAFLWDIQVKYKPSDVTIQV